MYTRPPIIYCARCNEQFADFEEMACTGSDEYWHLRCFVCAQCFKPFNKDHEYYEFAGRKYCQQDFQTLFAPSCSRCNQCITFGRFIRAQDKCWHPNCFLCDECRIPLADLGYVRSRGRNLCHDCNIQDKTANLNNHICNKCKAFIVDEKPLFLKDEPYHSYHFNCHSCGIELKPDALKVNGDFFCIKCHDKMDIPICGACRRPIEERVVTALGKQWHVEHFACSACEKPFLGKRHYEVKGSAYCEEHYYHLFGHQCSHCGQVIQGEVICALGKYFCTNHFSCHYCGIKLVANKSKFYDVNSDACCKKCYKKFPYSLRKRIAKQRQLSLDEKASK